MRVEHYILKKGEMAVSFDKNSIVTTAAKTLIVELRPNKFDPFKRLFPYVKASGDLNLKEGSMIDMPQLSTYLNKGYALLIADIKKK